MKSIICSVLLTFLLSTCIAQTKDTLKYHRILLVSYNPDYYLSDAEQDLMKQNRRTPDQYREYLRRSLDNKVAGQLEKKIACTALLPDTTRKTRENTWDFYNISGLQYTKPYGKKATGQAVELKKFTDKKEPGQHDASAYSQLQGDVKVMDNTVGDSAWLRAFATAYDSDLILSINQFEFKTNYNSCMDISRGIYRREVWVHYTLMQANGKRIMGDVSIAAFPSNANAVEEIGEKAFPQIAAEIATRVGLCLQ